MLAFVAVFVCLAGLLGAGTVLVNELVRPPTPAEQEAAAQAEMAGRWRTWPAGKIFPERLTYVSETQSEETARRVGIGRGHDCTAVVVRDSARDVRSAGCKAAVRATYLDQPQGVVITLAVLAFDDPGTARRASERLGEGGQESERLSLRALPVQRTAAARFTDVARQRQTTDAYGPYVVMSTAGYTDGRPAKAVDQLRDEPFELGKELAADIASALAHTIAPDCAQERMWAC